MRWENGSYPNFVAILHGEVMISQKSLGYSPFLDKPGMINEDHHGACC